MKKRYVLGAVAAIAAVVVVGAVLSSGQQGQSPAAKAEEASPITAKGTIQPARQARLSFRTAGQIVVLAKSGEQVAAGQELGRLDTTELDLAVAQAEDAVAIEEALLAQAEAPAREIDLAAAAASYQGALAKHNQLLSGATPAELDDAEGAVAKAKATLAEAQRRQEALAATSGQRAADIQAAELQFEQAKNTLWATQIDRDGICGNKAIPEFQCHAADARVGAADTAAKQAATALEAKRAAVSAAELKAATETVASAQADLQAAEAHLAQLKSGGLPDEKEASAAQVAQAKAAYELKKSGAAPTDIAVLKARLKQAQTALAQAKASRSAAVIVSPFSGAVVSSAANVGDTVTPGTPLLIVADLSQLEVQTSDLDEASAAKIAVGQPVILNVNAFADKALAGTVKEIALLATTTPSGDANYTATITLGEQDAALRLGMTTKIDFGAGK